MFGSRARGFGGTELMLVFMICGLCFLMVQIVSCAAHRQQALATVMPKLFDLVESNTEASRQAIEGGALEDLNRLGLDSVQMSVSPQGTPLAVRLGRLEDNDSCPAVVSYLRQNPKLIERTEVSFNGTPLTEASQLDDLSCGGHLATSVLRVAAKSGKPAR